jgi:hypothetical protein
MKHKTFTTKIMNKGVPQIRPSNRFYYATALSSCVLEPPGAATFLASARGKLAAGVTFGAVPSTSTMVWAVFRW